MSVVMSIEWAHLHKALRTRTSSGRELDVNVCQVNKITPRPPEGTGMKAGEGQQAQGLSRGSFVGNGRFQDGERRENGC